MFVVEGFIIGFVILGFFVFMQNLIPSTFQNFKKVFINMLCIAIRQIDVDICESYKLLPYCFNSIHYCPQKSFNISKSNKLIVTHQN